MTLNKPLVENYIKRIMNDYNIPGLALGIICKNEIVYAQGLGYRDLKSKLPVTDETMFPIGSITKSFTASAIAILADEGIIDLALPIKHYLPEFKFFTNEGTNKITVCDLLAHRTGLPRHDFLLFSKDCYYDELIKRLPYLAPIYGFRERFEYNNIMYVLAGMLSAKLNQTSWNQLISEKILTKLNMTKTCSSIKELKKYNNIALPHQVIDNHPHEISFRDLDAQAPAGAINSTLQDMLQYLRFHLQNIKNASHSISKISEIYQPQMPMPSTFSGIPCIMPILKEFDQSYYGLGLITTKYKNHYMIHHGGEVPGFLSMLCMLPDQDIGIIILMNASPNLATIIASLDIVDILLDLEHSNWSKYFKSFDKSLEAAMTTGNSIKLQNKKLDNNNLDNYVGSYKHLGYGIINITRSESMLNIGLNNINAVFQEEKHDVFKCVTNPLQDLRIFFDRDLNGIVTNLHTYLQSDSEAIVFCRFANPNMLPHKIIGPYYLDNQNYHMDVTITEKGDYFIQIPDKPLYSMHLVKDYYFSIPKLPDHSIQFFNFENDQTIKMIYYRGNQAIVLTKRDFLQ